MPQSEHAAQHGGVLRVRAAGVDLVHAAADIGIARIGEDGLRVGVVRGERDLAVGSGSVGFAVVRGQAVEIGGAREHQGAAAFGDVAVEFQPGGGELGVEGADAVPGGRIAVGSFQVQAAQALLHQVTGGRVERGEVDFRKSGEDAGIGLGRGLELFSTGGEFAGGLAEFGIRVGLRHQAAFTVEVADQEIELLGEAEHFGGGEPFAGGGEAVKGLFGLSEPSFHRGAKSRGITDSRVKRGAQAGRRRRRRTRQALLPESDEACRLRNELDRSDYTSGKGDGKKTRQPDPSDFSVRGASPIANYPSVPRRNRCILPGVPCHITQRGVDRCQTFAATRDHLTYLRLLRDNLPDADVRLLGFCLMSNHLHLIAIPQREDSLAVLLRRVQGRYAQYFNTLSGKSGHLWQNRYFACALGAKHLWNALAYVDQNPVRAGVVDQAQQYPWSSAAAHISGNDTAGILDMSWWRREACDLEWDVRLREADPDTVLALRRCTYAGRPFGDDAFVTELSVKFGRYWSRGRPKKQATAAAAAQNPSA